MRAHVLPLCGAALVVAAFCVGCGARSGLYELAPDSGRDSGKDSGKVDAPDVFVPDCEKDQDCEGFEDKCNPVRCNVDKAKCETLTPVNCDDKDPCTNDLCDSAKGTCSHPSATVDNDKDGHKGPLPGHKAGDPGSCGDDCNDTSALAFPGNKELCDGIDNDCNGIVDDNATFVPANQTDVQVDPNDDAPAGPAGLAYSGDEKSGYMAAYWGTSGGKTHSYLQALSLAGQKIGQQVQVTMVNADASGGVLVWTGDRYGIAWNDRRNGDYEIYFNQLGPDGTKLYPDLRISDAYGFSLYPQIAFNGLYFLIVWEDEREGPFDIWAQRVDLQGNLVGDNIQLTNSAGDAEAPVLAVGDKGIGVAWNYGGTQEHQVRFQLFDPEFNPTTKVQVLNKSIAGIFPSLVWNKQSYVAAWFNPDESPYAIYGAVIDEAGTVTVPAKVLTQSPKHSRYPSLLPLGDRLMMMYADDRDSNGGYELYAQMLNASLNPLSAETRVTTAIGDSVYPIASFGPSGNMGVLFRDDRSSAHHVYFTRLECVSSH